MGLKSPARNSIVALPEQPGLRALVRKIRLFRSSLFSTWDFARHTGGLLFRLRVLADKNRHFGENLTCVLARYTCCVNQDSYPSSFVGQSNKQEFVPERCRGNASTQLLAGRATHRLVCFDASVPASWPHGKLCRRSGGNCERCCMGCCDCLLPRAAMTIVIWFAVHAVADGWWARAGQRQQCSCRGAHNQETICRFITAMVLIMFVCSDRGCPDVEASDCCL